MLLLDVYVSITLWLNNRWLAVIVNRLIFLSDSILKKIAVTVNNPFFLSLVKNVLCQLVPYELIEQERKANKSTYL